MQEHPFLTREWVVAVSHVEATPGEPMEAGISQSAPHEKLSASQCRFCGSENIVRLRGEVAMRFPGLKNIDMPIARVFPEILACLDCATAQFPIPEAELRMFAKREAAAG